MIDKVVNYTKNLILVTEHIDELKKCRDDISHLEHEVAALKAFQQIVQGSIEIQFRGGNK